MKYKTLKLTAMAISAFSCFSPPVLADNAAEPVIKEICPEQPEKPKEDTDYTRVFKEGTLNLISPFTQKQDTLNILFSHNFLVSTFPHGNNPAFHFNYAPINNLQLDAIFSLRYSPLEFEAGIKYQILNEFEGAPVSLTPRISFNTRGNILGLDISATKIFFDNIWQVGLGYRILNYFGDPKVDDLSSNIAQGVGVNTIVRVWKQWHLFGDIVLPFDSNLINKHGFIWSAGIKKRIPNTPHILTLFVGNSYQSTVSGRTISTDNGKYPDILKVGFNYSIGIPNASKFPERLF